MKRRLVKYWWPLVVSILGAGLVGTLVVALWQLFTTPFQGSDVSSKVVVGGLALVGVLTTATVSAVGIFLKQSIDRRTLEVSQVNQQRLQMETAVETVKLLTSDSGESASKAQASAALLVLSRLGEIGLAIDLVAELWPKNLITTSAAVHIVDHALQQGSATLQRAAAVTLLNNVGQLDTAEHQWEWPESLETWPMWLDPEARATIAFVLSKWLEIRKPLLNDDDFRIELEPYRDR